MENKNGVIATKWAKQAEDIHTRPLCYNNGDVSKPPKPVQNRGRSYVNVIEDIDVPTKTNIPDKYWSNKNGELSMPPNNRLPEDRRSQPKTYTFDELRGDPKNQRRGHSREDAPQHFTAHDEKYGGWREQYVDKPAGQNPKMYTYEVENKAYAHRSNAKLEAEEASRTLPSLISHRNYDKETESELDYYSKNRSLPKDSRRGNQNAQRHEYEEYTPPRSRNNVNYDRANSSVKVTANVENLKKQKTRQPSEMKRTNEGKYDSVNPVSKEKRTNHNAARRTQSNISAKSQHQTLKQNYSSAGSENSQMGLLPISDRRSKHKCLRVAVVCTVLVLIGLVSAVTVVLINPEESAVDDPRISMVRAVMQLTIVNRQFSPGMSAVNSNKFLAIAAPLCKEIDKLYLGSKYRRQYYGCNIQVLRKGSVRAYTRLLFLDKRKVHNPVGLLEVVRESADFRYWNDEKVVPIGDFLIRYEDMEIALDMVYVIELPEKPVFMVSGSTPMSSGPNFPQPKLANTDDHIVPIHDNDVLLKKTKRLPLPPLLDLPPPPPLHLPPPPPLHHSPSPTHPPPPIHINQLTKTKALSPPPPLFPPPQINSSVPPLPSLHPRTTSKRPQSGLSQVTGTVREPLQKVEPGIFMSNTTAFLGEGPAIAHCIMAGFDDWLYITITHLLPSGGNILVANTSRTGNTPASVRVHVNVNWNSTHTDVALNFTTVQCGDEGSYRCQSYGQHSHQTSTGRLHVIGKPRTPVLNLPIEIVEGREITDPVDCTANVGYPPGRIQWFIKPRGFPNFIPLDAEVVNAAGVCSNILTSSFVYTPTRDGNGTVLKCEVVNQQVSSEEKLVATTEIRVIPEDVCRNMPSNSTIRHPFTCTKYIVCQDRSVFVRQCPNDLCFNYNKGTCGETALTMSSIVAYMNEGVASIKCRLLHIGSWKSVTISKLAQTSPGGKQIILKAINESGIQVFETQMKSRILADIRSSKYEVDLNMLVNVLACDDQGSYVCEAELEMPIPPAEGKITIRVKPSVPEVVIPVEIVENRQLREHFTCSADVGYPRGQLMWKMRYKNETEFHNIPFNETVTSEEHNCSLVVKRSFSFLPTPEHDGMELICKVVNNRTLPELQTLWTKATVNVVLENFCDSRKVVPMRDPDDCRNYIWCIQGYAYVQRCSKGTCFNSNTMDCDLPEPSTDTEVDPNHPCGPEKNGVYFPHAFLCNMYIWCVQGSEISQYCPMGTMYFTNGQCTFNIMQSHCFQRNETNTEIT